MGGTGRTKGGSVMYRLEFCQPFKVESRISSIITRSIWKVSNISFSSTWKKGYIRKKGVFCTMNPWLTVSRSSKRVVTRKVNNLYKDHNSSLLIFKGGVEIYMLLSYNTYCLIKIKFFIYHPKDYIKNLTGWNSSCRQIWGRQPSLS